jgi:peptidoglycan/xylan/chitin deacetylase (PgdA/CDA1 family)
MFHKITKYPASSSAPQLYVSPARFRKLLADFQRKGLQSISISEAVRAETRISDRFVISFDDGYEGTLVYAAQALKQHRFTAIQFLVADRLGQRNEWDLGLDTTMERIMDRSQVQDWLSLGFEIGAHTLTHPRLPNLPIPEAKNEVADSKKKLEDLFGVTVKHFAYPYGEYNNAILDLVREAGFETACTCETDVVRHGVDPFRLPRFFVDETSLRSFSNYELSQLRDDANSLARRARRTAGRFFGKKV